MKRIIFSILLLIYGLGYAQQIWFEGFESTGFPPAGWYILDVSGIRTWERSTDYAHSGNASATHDFAAPSFGMQETALVTPPITLPNYGSPTLDFWSRVQLIGYQYSGVLVSTTVNDDINAFTEIKVLQGGETEIAVWKNITVPLDAYLGQTVYIAFLYKNTDGHRWFIDDVSITHFEGFVDLQATGITPITGEYAIFSQNEPVTMRIKNNGGNAASGFSVKLLHNGAVMATETFTGSIPSLGEATYTFNAALNLSAAGIHKIQAVVNMLGDAVPANDTVTAMVTNLGCQIHASFPLIEGFENNGTNLPPCWTQEDVLGTQKWKVHSATSAQGIPGLEPLEAFEGTYKVVFYEIGGGAIAKLITPPLNLTSLNNPVLKFHHIQQQYVNDQDSLKIYYKTSAHGEWVFIEKYTSKVMDWTERVIPLPEPSSEYYIAFEGYGEYGHSVQIDALTIGHYFDTDIAVKAITPEGTHLGLSNQQEIKVTIQNNGRAPVTNFDVSLYRNGSFVTTELFTGTIPALGEVIYTFIATLDLSVSGTYTIKVVADLEGDEVVENNELTVTVKNLVCDALTFPYDEGFEEDIFPPHCWTTAGPGWERRTYSAHTGLGRAVYPWWEGTEGWLITPKFSLPANGDFMLEFWSHVYEAQFFVYSGVWISTTNTNTTSFIELHELFGAEIPNEQWIKIQVPLTAYAGQNIYLAFKYRNNGGQSGHMWSVDDVNIYNLNTYIDAELVAISAPPSLGVDLTNEEAVTVQIKNNGNQAISNFLLKLNVNETLQITETFTGTIPSLNEGEYTFSQKIDLSDKNKGYKMTATVEVAGDEVAHNNSKTITVVNFSGETAEMRGYQIYDASWMPPYAPRAFVKFSTASPSILTELHPYAENTISAGAYADGSLYFYTLNTDNGIPIDFVKINAKDFSLLANTPTTYEAADMTLDPTTNKLYGIAHVSATESRLVTINFEDGIMTPVGNMGRYLFTLACNDVGEMYGIDAAGNFCSVNKTTGATMVIGNTGATPYRSQSMSFNKKGRLFWAMFNNNMQGKLLEVHVNTGICYHYGALGNNAELVMLFDPLTISSIKETIGNEDNPLIIWAEGDKLYIGGLNIGDSWSVYSVMGQLVHQGIAHKEIESFTPKVRGVYIIQSGNRVVKAVY